MTVIGVDFGTSTMIAARLKNNQVDTKVIPSLVVPMTISTSGIGASIKKSNRNSKELIVGYDGMTYYIGTDKFGRAAPRRDSERFTNSVQMQVLVLATLAVSAPNEELDVVLALPQHLFRNMSIDENGNSQLMGDLEWVFIGEKKIQIGSKMRTVKINSVTPIEQSLAGYVHHFVSPKRDKEGDLIERVHDHDKNQTITVLQLGGGTLDVVTLRVIDDEDVEFDETQTKESDLGMYQLASRVQDWLNSQGTPLSLPEADNLVVKFLKREPVKVPIKGKLTNINDSLLHFYSAYVDEQIAFITSVVGNAGQRPVLAYGRPFLQVDTLLVKQLRNVFPNFIIDSPDTGVAVGALTQGLDAFYEPENKS